PAPFRPMIPRVSPSSTVNPISFKAQNSRPLPASKRRMVPRIPVRRSIARPPARSNFFEMPSAVIILLAILFSDQIGDHAFHFAEIEESCDQQEHCRYQGDERHASGLPDPENGPSKAFQ